MKLVSTDIITNRSKKTERPINKIVIAPFKCIIGPKTERQ